MNSPFIGNFRVTQVYKGETHKGIDIVGIDDKKVRSTINGVVEAARWDNKTGATIIDTEYGMGQYIRIKDNATGHRYYFAHLSEMLVASQQNVSKGDIIGIEGSSGNATGPHLHYEIRENTDNNTFLNVSQISGIPNTLGTYYQNPDFDQIKLDDAINMIQNKAGLDNNTMQYLSFYKYSEDLIKKLALAMMP